MAQISIEIKSCKECPFFQRGNIWSSDGWDRMHDWICSKSGNKIQGAVEWHEESKIDIPKWWHLHTKWNKL